MKLLVILLPLLALASCSESTGAAASGKVVVVKDRELQDSDYKIPGKVTVLDFTADW